MKKWLLPGAVMFSISALYMFIMYSIVKLIVYFKHNISELGWLTVIAKVPVIAFGTSLAMVSATILYIAFMKHYFMHIKEKESRLLAKISETHE